MLLLYPYQYNHCYDYIRRSLLFLHYLCTYTKLYLDTIIVIKTVRNGKENELNDMFVGYAKYKSKILIT